MQTKATIRSNPPGLKNLLPPVPTELSTQQQNTLTVRVVHPDGSADIENRFDKFEFKSDLPERLPENLREAAQQAQQELTRRVSGQTVITHYDRTGRLLSFEGADEMLQQLDVPLREPLRQILRLFLEQISGNMMYPDHRVKPGEEWKRNLATQANAQYPFSMEGESTLRYSGKTKYRGVKAAVVDFNFTNVLKPELGRLRQAGPLAQLEASGMELDLRVDGWGQGRMLLALDDGRILQNHATLRQTLSAHLKSLGGVTLATADPVTLEIAADTALEVEGSGKK